MHLDKMWMPVGSHGAMGLIGFCPDSEQAPDLKNLKLWFYLVRDYRDNPARYVISQLFRDIVWEDEETAKINVQLATPLRNSDGLLKRFAEQIETALYHLGEQDAREAAGFWLDDDSDDFLETPRVYSASGELGGIEVS